MNIGASEWDMHFNVVSRVGPPQQYLHSSCLPHQSTEKDLKCKLCMLCPYMKDILPFLLVSLYVKYQA